MTNTLDLCFGHRVEVWKHASRGEYPLSTEEMVLISTLVPEGPGCLVCSGRLVRLDAESLRAALQNEVPLTIIEPTAEELFERLERVIHEPYEVRGDGVVERHVVLDGQLALDALRRHVEAQDERIEELIHLWKSKSLYPITEQEQLIARLEADRDSWKVHAKAVEGNLRIIGEELNEKRDYIERLETEVLRYAMVCSQCGQRLVERACGPTHAVVAADPSRHIGYTTALAATQKDLR